MSAPALPHNCNSWVIVNRHTRDAVRETFSKSLADSVAKNEADRFEVLTAIEWLREFNARQR